MVMFKKKAYVIVLPICLIGAIYYYLWLPRISIGYNNFMVSKHYWDYLYEQTRHIDTIHVLYRHRLDDDLSYQAYLVTPYYCLSFYLNGNEGEMINMYSIKPWERLHHGIIKESDEIWIKTHFQKHRDMFITSLKQYQYRDEERDRVLLRGILSFYFSLYYDSVRYGKEMDTNELDAVVNWLNRQDDKPYIEKSLEDPFRWRILDINELYRNDLLKDYIEQEYCPELLKDIELYKKYSKMYRDFLIRCGLELRKT